jgi:hypothetical protein
MTIPAAERALEAAVLRIVRGHSPTNTITTDRVRERLRFMPEVDGRTLVPRVLLGRVLLRLWNRGDIQCCVWNGAERIDIAPPKPQRRKLRKAAEPPRAVRRESERERNRERCRRYYRAHREELLARANARARRLREQSHPPLRLEAAS